MKASVSYRIACDDPSRWSVSFTRQDDHIEVGLHYGDKPYANQGFDMDIADFKAMMEVLLG